MRNRVALSALLMGLALVFTASDAQARAREEGRLLTATEVLQDIRDSRDQFIPDRLLDRAYGIVVVPSVTKIAWFAGGRWGKGVMVVRDKDGHFTNPVFVRLAGGSFGFQWGAQSTDIVLVFTTRAGIEGITGGKLTLGADASVAAGPVGRAASAATDQNFAAEVYSYSRSRGAFAGIALDGTSLSVDQGANQSFYKNDDVKASDIINGTVTTDDNAAKRFLAAVQAGTAPAVAAADAAAAPAASGDVKTSTSASGPKSPGDAQTFPLADPKPGTEPR